MQLWLWTLNHVQTATDADGAKLYHKTRQGVTFPLADALCWLLAARQFILDVVELEAKGAANPAAGRGLGRHGGVSSPTSATCNAPAPPAKSAASAPKSSMATTAIPAWDETSCHACYCAEELDALEGMIPGIDGSARAYSDVAEAGEAHPLQGRPVREVRRAWKTSSACAPSWTAASPAAAWPKTAPPKR